jgi:DNA-binding NarL/FixJ family response regulator
VNRSALDSNLGIAGITIEVIGAPQALVGRVRDALPGAAVASLPPTPHARRSGEAALIIVYEVDDMSAAVLAGLIAVASTVVISERPSVEQALATLEAGADGYIDAGLDPMALRAALVGVLRGELAFSRKVVGLSIRLQRMRSAEATVTPRQHEILRLIAHGATDKEIANVMGLRTTTVQKSVARLLRHLRVRNRAEAVATLPPDPDE